MARFSNGVITIINLLTLVLSFSAIALSLWLYAKHGSPCERMLRTPLLVVGGALLVVSMMGLLGSCCRVSLFMWLYLITLFLLILGLISFTAFAIVVTNKGIGHALSETGIGNGKLGDYHWWLQNYVLNPSNWDRIKSCLIHMKMCQSSSPLQLGCCKPPNDCGMSEKGPAVPDPDCKIWSNEQTQLCYNCESCKVAALDNVKREWRMLAIINTIILVSITVIYSIGCCALRNNQNYGYSKYRNF